MVKPVRRGLVFWARFYANWAIIIRFRIWTELKNILCRPNLVHNKEKQNNNKIRMAFFEKKIK